MATEPFEDMPKIRLEKDDLDSFHRTRAQSSTKSSKSSSHEPQDSGSSSGSPSWFVVLFLFLILAGAGGYWSFLQYKVLEQAQNRITELESRLSATGEDMDQSAAALQVKVSELSKKSEELWEQMDKLWASAWRRNQSEIAALNKTVMTLKASSEKSAQNASSELSSTQTEIGLLKEQLENQASVLNQANEKLSQVNSTDLDFEQQLASLREKLISTALANNDLTNQIDDLRRKVAATDKKIDEVKTSTPPSTTPQF